MSHEKIHSFIVNCISLTACSPNIGTGEWCGLLIWKINLKATGRRQKSKILQNTASFKVDITMTRPSRTTRKKRASHGNRINFTVLGLSSLAIALSGCVSRVIKSDNCIPPVKYTSTDRVTVIFYQLVDQPHWHSSDEMQLSGTLITLTGHAMTKALYGLRRSFHSNGAFLKGEANKKVV